MRLYVIQAAEPSGAETAMAPLLAADPDALVACPAGSATADYVHGLGVATVDLPFRVLRHSGGRAELARSVVRGLSSAMALRRVVRSHPERTVVYANSLRPGMLAMVAAAGLGRRVVWVMTDFLPPPPLRQAIRGLTRVTGAHVIAHSASLERSFTAGSPRLRRRVTIVHPGLDLGRFDGVERPDDPAPRAVIVGHVSPTKQTALALEVALRVARERPDFRLDVVGAAQFREEDFAYEQALRERVAGDPELAQRVVLHGRTDVRPVLAGAALLLHCRPDEPFGMVVIEAMAAGLPVVAPDSAGPAEIVRDGETGLLYPPGDADAAAACVLRLLGDGALAGRMGEAARASVAERFEAGAQLAALEAALGDGSGRDPGTG